ncbi:hypothetical protein [Microbacterium sp. 1.5R]|uniref:hypothetical protein n=1 Tax=Microbacterium sp. 1.5R TaxID=1916917 RepID=UPI0011A1C4EA|nr:hypothetical protein [Microbacterium sp. 1.5R]
MDRRLVLNAQIAVERGHRLDIMEAVDEESGRAAVLQFVDLDTGIRYVADESTRGEVVRWSGRVLDCTVTIGAGARTVLTVDVEGDGAGATNARAALLGADAAAEAAKAEADRWGGADGVPEPEADRFW